jgi:hypothetical protein
MVRVDQGMAIGGHRTKAAGFAEQFAVLFHEGFLGLDRQRGIPFEVPVLPKLTDAFRGGLFQGLDVARRQVAGGRDSLRCFKDSLI